MSVAPNVAAPTPKTRVYIVTDKKTGDVRMVRCSNPTEALKHVISNRFESVYAEQDAIVEAVSNGVGVEVIREEPTDNPAQQPLTGVPGADGAVT